PQQPPNSTLFPYTTLFRSNRAMNRTESPDDIKARLKYEKSNIANNDKGAEINGLRWATRNVGTPNKFVVNPEDFGMHYQFNRKSDRKSTRLNSSHVKISYA